MPKSSILPLIAVVALCGAIWHVASTHEVLQATQPPIEPSRSPYKDRLAGAGLVEPASENIKVGTLTAGVVTEVAVKVGDDVSKNQLLFKLDDRQRRADLATQEAELAAREAEYQRLKSMPRPEDIPPSEARVKKARADVDAQKDLLDRAESLYAKKVWREEELIQKQESYAAAQAKLNEAEAEHAKLLAGAWEPDLAVSLAAVKRAQAMVSQSRIEVERLEVRAPIAGKLLKVDVRVGEYVGTPPNETLIVIGDLSRFHVRIDIDENDIPRYRPGIPGQAFVRGDALHPLPLDFIRVDPYAEPKKSLTGAGNERVDTRVLQVIYAINGPVEGLYVGQQVDAYLSLEPKPSTPAETSTVAR